MKEIKLKPCPFCGNAKFKVDRKSKFAGYNGLDHRVEQHTYSVRCTVCYARGGAVGGRVLFGHSLFGTDILPNWATTDAELKKKAIEAWNRRADDKQREAD
jgi:Lar family restriction alleviation protein